MSNENDMVDEEMVGGGGEEQGSAKVAPAPDTATTGQEKTMEADAGSTKYESQCSLFLVLIASIVLVVATGAFYDWNIRDIGGYSGYAITVPFVSLATSLIGLLLARFGKFAKFGHFLNMLTFLYSFIGACFLTFDKPFTETGNGYFAAWTIVFGSAMALGMNADTFGSTIKNLGPVMGLFVSSMVVMIACATYMKDDMTKTGEVIYATILAVVTFVFILFTIMIDKMTKSKLPGMLNYFAFGVLAGCWIIEACLVTFRGPFEVTGNGYFGSWAGAATSTMAAFDALKAM